MFFFNRELHTRHKLCMFPISGLELIQKTIGQNHGMPLGNKQYLCKVRTLCLCFSVRKIFPRHYFCTFPPSDFEPSKMTSSQNHDIPACNKQSLSQVRTFNLSSYERHGPCTFLRVFFFFSAIKIVKMTFGQTRDTHSCEK